MKGWQEELLTLGVYSREELASLHDPGRICSWAPQPLYGPLTTTAISAGGVAGGVELWERQKGQIYWFLENLIRDPSTAYKGVGVELVSSAIGWWRANYGRYQTELRVHSILRENGAVQWWTRFLGRPPDFTDAFIRSRGFKFDAVGWIIHPPRLPVSEK
jgi:hypothetical protein